MDLFKKPTDRCQYLLPSSCHPSHVCQNIPKSLGLRLVRIVTNPDTLKGRMKELADLLISRDYKKKVVYDNLNEVIKIPRTEALNRVIRDKPKRTIFCLTFDPRLPDISKILKKHFSVLIKDSFMRGCFGVNPPMVAWRKCDSLKKPRTTSSSPTSRPTWHGPVPRHQLSCPSLCQGGEGDHLHQHRGQVHHPVLLQLSYHWSSLLHHLPQV